MGSCTPTPCCMKRHDSALASEPQNMGIWYSQDSRQATALGIGMHMMPSEACLRGSHPRHTSCPAPPLLVPFSQQSAC